MPRKPRRPREPIDTDGLNAVLTAQDGVIGYRQLRQLHVTPPDIERMLRRRELVRVHRCVYINHTGEPTRSQQEWAAVLAIPGAALADESALAPGRAGGARALDRIHLAVDARRNVKAPRGCTIHYVVGLEKLTQCDATSVARH
jgi:hypothetical protein